MRLARDEDIGKMRKDEKKGGVRGQGKGGK